MLLPLGVDGLGVGVADWAAMVRLLESLLEAFEAFSLKASSCFWRNEDDIVVYDAEFRTIGTVPPIVSSGQQTKGLRSAMAEGVISDAELVVNLEAVMRLNSTSS
jgi:hypothetical protein